MLLAQTPSEVKEMILVKKGFPGGSDGKETACNVEDLGSIPELGRSHSNPLHYSCLENSMDRRAWWATVQRVAKESEPT